MGLGYGALPYVHVPVGRLLVHAGPTVLLSSRRSLLVAALEERHRYRELLVAVVVFRAVPVALDRAVLLIPRPRRLLENLSCSTCRRGRASTSFPRVQRRSFLLDKAALLADDRNRSHQTCYGRFLFKCGPCPTTEGLAANKAHPILHQIFSSLPSFATGLFPRASACPPWGRACVREHQR